MPEGIIATVDGGFATIDFVDQSLRGPALAEVLEAAGPGVVQTITRDGPRRKYRMPTGNAQAAGLLDGDEVGAVYSAGADTGAADALVAADPNENPGGDNANWHTPVAEHTSANKYVGTVPNSQVLHGRPQVHTGDSTSYGGGDAPTHREVIDHVKENTPPRAAPAQTFVRPAAESNLSFATQTGALGSDPGGIPDGAPHPFDQSPDADQPEAVAEEPAAEGNGVGDDGVVEYPAGAPSTEWRRDELDAYALNVKGLDTTGLPNKQAVVDAIEEK